MNNHLINVQSTDTGVFQERKVTPSLKLIVFVMGNLHLALHIESVYKVVNKTVVHSTGMGSVGIAHVGNREVTVVDLYRRFFKESQISSNSVSHLVLVQNTTGELYGIPVADTPILMEVPLSMIRVLPQSYRQANTLDVASHVAVIPQEASPLTVFLLDVDLLLPLFQQSKTAK